MEIEDGWVFHLTASERIDNSMFFFVSNPDKVAATRLAELPCLFPIFPFFNDQQTQAAIALPRINARRVASNRRTHGPLEVSLLLCGSSQALEALCEEVSIPIHGPLQFLYGRKDHRISS